MFRGSGGSGLIRTHEFNSAWWGKPAGIVDNAGFFQLPASEQMAALDPFEWAEFRSPMGKELPLRKMLDAGFMLVDTQIEFRIRLPKVGRDRGTDISLVTANDARWNMDTSDWSAFEHERFRYLPGIAPHRLKTRYTNWAENLVRQNPGHCFQILHEGESQGWFLGKPAGPGNVNLTLGVLRRTARVSGLFCYEAALEQYAQMGYRLGSAAFSVSNTAVHNIYGQLGARFLSPVGMWLWTRGN